MKILFSSREYIFFVLLFSGFIGSSHCNYSVLDPAKKPELEVYVASKEFLNQFVKLQHLIPAVFEDGFKVSVGECLGTDEVGYPQFACDISLAVLPEHPGNPATILCTATVFIAEHDISVKQKGKLEKSDESKMQPTIEILEKVKNISKHKTSKKYFNRSVEMYDPLLTYTDDNQPTLQDITGTNTVKSEELKKMQKQIFLIHSCIWLPVFKIGFKIASVLRVSEITQEENIREFELWVKRGMSPMARCTPTFLDTVKLEIKDRMEDQNFYISSNIDFVCDNRFRKLQVIVLTGCSRMRTYHIGAVYFTSKNENIEHHIITNFHKETLAAASKQSFNESVSSLKLPFMNWSLKQDLVPILSGQAIGVFKILTTMSDLSCVTYSAETTDNSCNTYHFIRSMELQDSSKIVLEMRQEIQFETRDEMFEELIKFSNGFPNWVTKVEPHKVTYPGLRKEFERLRKKYVSSPSAFVRNTYYQVTYEHEFVAEAVIVGTPRDIKVVVHALHVYKEAKHCETKYSLVIVSNEGSTVFHRNCDPEFYYKLTIAEWKSMLSKQKIKKLKQ